MWGKEAHMGHFPQTLSRGEKDFKGLKHLGQQASMGLRSFTWNTNLVRSCFPWASTRASTVVKSRAGLTWKWDTPKKALHSQPRGAATIHARVILAPPQGSYLWNGCKIETRNPPLNICICHLSRMSPSFHFMLFFTAMPCQNRLEHYDSLRAGSTGLITGWVSEH